MVELAGSVTAAHVAALAVFLAELTAMRRFVLVATRTVVGLKLFELQPDAEAVAVHALGGLVFTREFELRLLVMVVNDRLPTAINVTTFASFLAKSTFVNVFVARDTCHLGRHGFAAYLVAVFTSISGVLPVERKPGFFAMVERRLAELDLGIVTTLARPLR